jgi:ribosomal protein L37AE/L43A
MQPTTYSNSKWNQKCHGCGDEIAAGGGVFLSKHLDTGTWHVECHSCYRQHDLYAEGVRIGRGAKLTNPWANRWAEMGGYQSRAERGAMQAEALEHELRPTEVCPHCGRPSFSRPGVGSYFCADGHWIDDENPGEGRSAEDATLAVHETMPKYVTPEGA